MLVGVLSDTHGQLQTIQEVSRQLKEAGVELVLHLGDDYRDLEWFLAEGFRIIAVPGLYCPEFRQPQIPNLRLEEIGGVRFLLTHSPEFSLSDLAAAAAAPSPQIVLYGHTHIPDLSDRNGILWLNPGHLKDRDKRGHPPSYALLRFEPARLTLQIIRLADRTVLEEASFSLPDLIRI